jgi:hypothetical protein
MPPPNVFLTDANMEASPSNSENVSPRPRQKAWFTFIIPNADPPFLCRLSYQNDHPFE